MKAPTSREVLAILDPAHGDHTVVRYEDTGAIPALECSCSKRIHWNVSALAKAGISFKDAVNALRLVPRSDS